MHNWDDFRYFGAVAETGSFSQAAQSLGVNHSTVSRRIQAMEQLHGVKLFERRQTGYQLTTAGAAIYDLVVSLKQDTHKAARILQGHDARLEGTVNLTMPNDIYVFLLAKPLKEFNDQHPDITFNLMVSKDLKNMANREADLAVRVTPNPPDYLIGSLITQLQHAIYQHRDFIEMKETPIIIWGSEKELPDWALTYCDNPKIVMRVDDLFAMHQAVKAGLGIARMPCFLPDIINDPQVIKREQRLPRSNFGVWLLHHQDLRNSAKINACRQYLKKVLTDNKALFEGKSV